MSFHELADVLVQIGRDQAQAAFLPVELATVMQDAVNGPDLLVKPDAMSVALSWNRNELICVDGLILAAGDRVILVGINGGLNYVVLGKVATKPGTA